MADIVYNDVVSVQPPVRLRKAVHVAWLKALVKGSVGVLYDWYKVWRGGNVYYLAHNSQVCYMEAALNDTFDPVDRRIYIKDPIYFDTLYAYLDAEVLPVWLALDSEIGGTPYDAPVYAYTDAELGAAVAGFVVWVPASLTIPITIGSARLAALVNRYRLPSKKSWIVRTF